LSWELRVWTPNKATLKATYTDASPGGIVEGFRWSVRGDGNCEQLRFQAVPAKVDIAARDIVQLLVDGQPAFYGYIETAWPPDDGEKREYVAVGAAELLRQRLMDEKTYSQQDVAAIVRDIIDRLRHPAIAYDPSRVRDTSGEIELRYSALVAVHDVIADLSKAVGGVSWGVDATGTFFFNEPGQTATVGYELHGLNWLPVEGEEIVTSVALLLALPPQPEGARTWRGVVGVNLPYTEEPLGNRYYIHRYRDPADDIYAAEKAFVYADALVPWSERGRSASGTVANPANAVDGDPNSYAAGPGDLFVESPAGAIPPNGKLVWGQRATFVYESTSAGGMARLSLLGFNLGASISTNIEVPLPNTDGQRRVIELVMPVLPVGFAEIYTTRLAITGMPDGAKIYDARIYEYDAERLDEYAKSLVRLQHQSPAEVEWQGYQPPARFLTVTGAPGGGLTGKVETWEYELYPKRFRTIA